MKDAIVTMAVSGIQGMMPEYIRRLSGAGITVNVDDLSVVTQFGNDFSIATKLATLRFTASRFHDYEFIIASDGWDVMFYGDKDDLLSRIPENGVLWAAEKNCWPNESLADQFPDRGPWRFLNGGLLAGSPRSILEECNLIESHPQYKPEAIDQGFLNFLLSRDEITIDWETRLFFCLFKGYDELQFENGHPVNTHYGTQPLFIHANGNWSARDMFRRYEASLKKKVTNAVCIESPAAVGELAVGD